MLRLTIVVPGNPGDGAINAAMKAARRPDGKGGTRVMMTKTKRARRYGDRVLLFARAAKDHQPEAAAAIRGAPVVGAEITFYWPRRRHLIGTSRLALGDVDATIKATLDPMQDEFGKGKRKKRGAEIFDDDARVIDAIIRKRWCKDSPRVEIVLWPMEEPE